TLLGDTVKKHVLGSDASKDPLVFEQTDKSFYTSVDTTKDERYLLIRSRSTVSTEDQVARADDPTLHFNALIPRERDHKYAADHLGDRWIIRTNWQARNYRIVEAGDKDVGDRNAWHDVLANREDAFVDDFDAFNDFIAVQEHSNGLSNIRILARRGKPY